MDMRPHLNLHPFLMSMHPNRKNTVLQKSNCSHPTTTAEVQLGTKCSGSPEDEDMTKPPSLVIKPAALWAASFPRVAGTGMTHRYQT